MLSADDLHRTATRTANRRNCPHQPPAAIGAERIEVLRSEVDALVARQHATAIVRGAQTIAADEVTGSDLRGFADRLVKHRRDDPIAPFLEVLQLATEAKVDEPGFAGDIGEQRLDPVLADLHPEIGRTHKFGNQRAYALRGGPIAGSAHSQDVLGSVNCAGSTCFGFWRDGRAALLPTNTDAHRVMAALVARGDPERVLCIFEKVASANPRR